LHKLSSILRLSDLIPLAVEGEYFSVPQLLLILNIYRLRWQVYPYLTGYDYKNSIANGCFFNIGARLAKYTNNATYAQHAEKAWDWVQGVGLMDANWNIYDGAHIGTNCTDINKVQFSYNMAVFTLGAANMYNYVGSIP